jgi:hypothetical protein
VRHLEEDRRDWPGRVLEHRAAGRRSHLVPVRLHKEPGRRLVDRQGEDRSRPEPGHQLVDRQAEDQSRHQEEDRNHPELRAEHLAVAEHPLKEERRRASFP